MKLSPEQVQEILDAAKPDIIKGLKEEVMRQAQWDLTTKAGEMVRAEVQKFVTEEIVPEVRSLLADSKAGLIATAVPTAEAICELMAKSLAAQFKENMESSYKRRAIFEALFK